MMIDHAEPPSIRFLRRNHARLMSFLRRHGAPKTLRVIAISKDPRELSSLRRALGPAVTLFTFQDPLAALVAVGSIRPDAIVIARDVPGFDVRACLERLRSARANGLFYSAPAAQRAPLDQLGDLWTVALASPAQGPSPSEGF